MTWDEYRSRTFVPERLGYEETNVECPVCGKKIYKRVDIVLTSYPPTYRYECKSCGWYSFDW